MCTLFNELFGQKGLEWYFKKVSSNLENKQ